MEHKPANTLEYNYIDDGIYIGTNQCCQTHMDEALQKEGITVDVSLESIRLDQPFGVTFYAWIPVDNHTSPTQDQLEFGVSVLSKIVEQKRKVYVHCQNGHGRAPTVVAAYFISKGMTSQEAENFIKSKRQSIHLDDVQREALIKFAKNN